MKVFLTFDLLIRFTTRAGIDFSNNSRLEGFSGSDCMFQVPARLHYNLKVYWYLNVIPVMRRIFGDIPNSFSKYRGLILGCSRGLLVLACYELVRNHRLRSKWD